MPLAANDGGGMRKYCFFIFIFFILSTSVFAETQAPTSNIISMPWDAFMQLWVNAKDEEPGQPKAAYGRFLYLGEVDQTNDYLIHVTAKVDITTYTNEDRLVPILPNKMTLESFSINGKEIPWSIKDGYYCAFLGGQTKHEVEATFTLKPDIQGNTKKLKIPFLGQARQEFVLIVPEKNIQSYVDYGVSLETIEIDEGTQIHAYFKAYDNVSVIWYPKDENHVNVIAPLITNYARLTDEGVETVIKLHLDILEGSLQETEILVPENFLLDEISSNTSTTRFQSKFQSSEKKGYRSLRIVSNQELTGSQDIFVKGIYPSLSDSYIFSALMPLVPNADKLNGKFVLAGSQDKSYSVIRAKNMAEATLGLSDENPFTDSKLEHIYDVTNEESQLDLNVKNNQDFLNQSLKIQSLEVATLINESDKITQEITVKILNKKAQYLSAKLPAGSFLEDLKVDLKKVAAIQEGSDLYLIPLLTGQNEVSLSYTSPKQASWYGQIKVALPDFAFIPEHITWHLGAANSGQIFVLSKMGSTVSTDRISSTHKNLVKKWKTIAYSRPTAKSLTVSLIYLKEKCVQNIVSVFSVVIAIYLFWALTFFFERAYLPDYLYETRTFVLGSILCILLMVFLTLFETTQYGPFIGFIALSLFAFTSWQNRLVTKRFKILFQQSYKFLTPFIIIIYMFSMVTILLMGKLHFLILPSILLIIIHWSFLRVYPKLVEKRARNKVLPHLVMAFVLALSGSVQAKDVELKPTGELKEGHVYMEWNIIEDLLKKIEKKEVEKQKTAGLKYIFGTSKVTGDVSGLFAQIRIETPVQIMTDKWIQVPVVSQDQVVTEVSLDGNMLPLRTEGNLVFFEGTRSKNSVNKLEVEILLPLEKSGKLYSFRTESEFFKGANVSLHLEDDLMDASLNHVVWQKKEEGVVKAALDSTGQFDMQVNLSSEPIMVQSPSLMDINQDSAQHQIVSLIDKDLLTLKINTKFSSKDSLSDTVLELPDKFKVKKIEGEFLKAWREGNVVEGSIPYRLDFKENSPNEISVEIIASTKLTFDSGIIEVPQIKIRDFEKQKGVIVVGMTLLSEAKIYSLKGLRLVNAREYADALPPTSTIYKVFRFPDMDYELKISRGESEKNYQGISVIDQLEGSYTLDNSTSRFESNLKFNLNSSLKETLEIWLPKGSRLDKLLQNGSEATPVLGSLGGFEVNLEAGNNEFELHYTEVITGSKYRIRQMSMPQFSSRVNNLKVQLFIKNETALIPLWHSFGNSAGEAIRLLGIEQVFHKKPIRSFVISGGILNPKEKRAFVFFQWPFYLAILFYLIILATIAACFYILPGLLQTKKIVAIALIFTLLIFYLLGPFDWYVHALGITLGLVIRFLRDFFKNDSSIVI